MISGKGVNSQFVNVTGLKPKPYQFNNQESEPFHHSCDMDLVNKCELFQTSFSRMRGWFELPRFFLTPSHWYILKGSVYIGESFLFCENILGNFDRMWYRLSGIWRKMLYYVRMMDIISKQFTLLWKPLWSYCSYLPFLAALQKRKKKRGAKKYFELL